MRIFYEVLYRLGNMPYQRPSLRVAFLLVALLVLSGHETPDGGPGEGCDFEDIFYFGIASIPRVSGWSQSCVREAGDDWFNISGSEVSLPSLVNESYNVFNTNSWNWWIEGGWGDGSFCADDYTYLENTDGNCIIGETAKANCPINVWVQVVGECDNCIGNTLGGTWYKGELVIDPFDTGFICGNPRGFNMAELDVMPRTSCNDPLYPWGCGPGEFQD
jgi:hypothetical protein